MRHSEVRILLVLLVAAWSLAAARGAGGVLRPLSSTPEMPLLKEPGAADRLISLDFNQVDIRVFIKTVGQLTGVNFLVVDGVQGTVTLISPTKIRLTEVYGVLQSVLQTKGYAAVPAGTLVKVVPRPDGMRSNLPIRIGGDPQTIPQDDSLVTQVIPLKCADAAQVGTILTPLLSSGGQAVSFPETNTIVITDTCSVIHRAAAVLQHLDVEGPQDNVEVYPLKYASATRLSEQVVQILQRGPVPGRARGAAAAAAPVTSGVSTLKILPDERTNSVVVVANATEAEMAKRIITKLDVERPSEASNIHVISLKHAEAKELEKSISAAMGKITAGTAQDRSEMFQLTSDESTNSLIIVASPQDYKLVEGIVAELDVAREQVLVEFQIVEADEDALKQLGFDWATLDQATADSVRGFGYTNLGPRVEAASGDLQGIGVGLWKEVNGTPQIGAILSALEKNSAVKILSTPHVLTSNHQEARILVGENIPYVSQSRVTEFDPATPTAIRTFDFKDVGISLKVRPHVSTGGLVRLEIDANFTKLIEGATGLGNETPTTAKREAKTTIAVTSGTTVVIGGLMRDDKDSLEKKVPLLGDLPLVGVLFRFEKERIQRTNLLLFITPHVLADRDGLSEMTERKKREQNHDGILDGPQRK